MLTMLLFLAVCAVMLAGLVALVYLVARKFTGTRMPLPDSTPSGSAAPAPGSAASPFAPRVLDSLTLRALLIGLIALLMTIPLLFVQDIVAERGSRHGEVLDDIARTWGQSQVLTGPVLVVPFTEVTVIEESVVDKDGTARTLERTVRRQRSAHFLPTDLGMDVTLSDEIRERGIFRSLVYEADVRLDARFDPIRVATLSDTLETVHWDKAWVSIGLSDTRAISDVSTLVWNDEARTLSPGTRVNALPSGFHAALTDIEEGRAYTLGMRMSARGSDAFRFAPFGETTTVELRSSWPHPSFRGSALPDAHEISDTGFGATWEIPHLARNYPQSWLDDGTIDLYEFTAGVSMFETVSLYSQITRSVKYGLLFIGLTFLTLLIFELALARPLHAVQYALVGVALCVFFLVLLALSEHLGFLLAYAGAATLTILMISLYTGAVLRSAKRGVGVFALLTALYAILYSLLQLEDYALLLGTALLVGVIAVLMVVTRDLHRRPVPAPVPAPAA